MFVKPAFGPTMGAPCTGSAEAALVACHGLGNATSSHRKSVLRILQHQVVEEWLFFVPRKPSKNVAPLKAIWTEPLFISFEAHVLMTKTPNKRSACRSGPFGLHLSSATINFRTWRRKTLQLKHWNRLILLPLVCHHISSTG